MAVDLEGIPPNKKNCISAEFLYFGARFFYHLTTTVEQAPVLRELSTLNDVQHVHAGDMLDAIERDMKDLTLSRVGEKKKIDWQADGYFTKLPVTDDRCVYVYNHKQYVTCSSVLLSHLNRMWFIIDQSGGGLVSCQEHQYHDDLQPFFMDNNFLLKYYEHAISMGRSEVKPQAELLKKIQAGERFANGTGFECPVGTSNNWSENDWTKRLVRGIEKICPQVKVTFSANMGTTFEAELLRQLRVHAASEYFFLFRGAPDIIIQSGNAAMICHSEDITTDEDKDAESSGDEAIENCHQRTPLHGLSSTDPPEKVGKLFASLHILLVSKILRKVHCGKEIHRKFEVKGLLVDKMCGVIYCSLYVEMRNGESRLKLDMKNYIGCALTPESLCYHIRAITSRELPA